jgi:hypothetical protein
MRRLTSIFVAAATLALAGCGSSGGGAKDAGVAGHDGAAGGSAGAGAGTGGGAGTTGGAGMGGAGTGGPAGAPGSSIKKLVSGGAVALVGSGEDTCTSLPGATTDRWCGFVKQGANNAIELWVLDVTMLGAGAAVACDGTSPGCLRLSQTVFFDQDFGFANDHFYGDTLIYYADASAAATSFSGTIWAWKPGWPAGRKLTSTIGNDCIANPKGDAVTCIQGSAQITAGELSVELLAGHLPATADAGLPSLERIVIVALGDPQGVQKWQVAFSPDGAYVGWSARDKAASPETLKVQKLEDATSRQTVATNVSRWQITQDGKSWLWLSAFNYDASAPSGTLESQPFPTGTSKVGLASGVAMYQTGSDGSILFQTATGGELRRMPNPATPAATQLLDSPILGVLDSSPDGKTVLYVKSVDQTSGLFDLWARDVTAMAPCAVDDKPQAVTASLFAKGSTVLWARLDPLTGNLQGTATTVADCKATPFANNVLRWIPAGDDALTILDDTAQTDDDSTLRYSRLVNGALPAQGTALQTHVQSVYAPAVPGAPVILYTSATMATAGLYAYIGPPLVATTPPAADAGTTEAGADAAADVAAGSDAADAGPAASDASDAGAGGDADTGG